MAIIKLDIGADVNKSVEQMRKDLTEIVRQINDKPNKVKLGLDEKYFDKEIKGVKVKLDDIRKEAANIKFSDQISTSLTNITSSLGKLTETVAGVSGLKTELNSLSEAMRNFQGVSISLSSSKNPVQQMSQYGQAARALIADMKAQATDMEMVLSRIYGGKGTGVLETAGRGLNVWEVAKTASLSLQKALTDSSNLSKQMEAYALYIKLMKSVASYKKIDMTPILRLDELEKGYAAVEKLRSGEQQAETEAQRLKGIFGSGINSEQLISKLDEIRLAIDRIVESLTNLNAKEVKIKFDDASLEDLRAQISQILTEMSAITPKAKKGSGGGGGGSDGSAAKESKLTYDDATRAIKDYYRALNDLRTIKGSQDITLEADGWHTENVELQGLVATLNRTKTAYDLVMAAMKDMPADQQAKLMQLLTSESTKYTIAVEKQAAAERAAAEASTKKKSDADAAKESKLTYDDATRAIKDYYRALNDLRTIKGSQDITLEADGWHTENVELQGLVATLNRTKTAYDLVMAAMKDMPADQQAKLMQLLTSESTKYTIAVEKQAAAERAAAEASTKKKSDADAAKESKKSYEDATRAIKAYYSLASKVNGTNGDVTRTSSGWVSMSGENTQLASSLNNAEKAYVECTSAAAANTRTREQNIQLERLEIAETDKLARSLEEQANRARPVAETEAARRNLMQSTLGTTNRAAGVLRDYQHVMKGHNETSKQAYENLKTQKAVLDDVRKKYNAGTASAEELRKAQDDVKTATKGATETFKANGEHVSSLGTRIKGLAQKFVSWLGVSQVIMYAVRSIKKMISAAVEIDAAMTQLKIVTNATDAEMRQFSNTAITLAKSLGKSVTELTKSIETFSRLGYSLKDASELAKYATIMSNVAGVGNDEATTGITSIVKGFNLNVSDAEHVTDVLVDVGQKYAVSAGELMEAYEKSGAALSATNTTLEKSAGLIAAANASVQDSSVVGTALKTVSARIRGSKSDLEELGENTEDLAEGFSKYAKEIKALTGFDIMIDDTHFKDLYDIMEGIASVWDKLSDTQQARVAEILGGTRQLQVISSIIGNWSDAAGAYETAMNSAGASAKANSVYMDSVTAHLDQLKATFEELATTVLNSDFSKFVIDTGKTILEILHEITSLTGSLGTILIGGGIYKGIKSIA